MAQVSKVSAQVDIKYHEDVFYKLIKDNLSSFQQLLPDVIKECKFLEGNEEDGLIVWYKYVLNGNTMTLTEKIKVDNTSKTLNGRVMEGDILKEYNSLKFKLQVYSGYVEVTIEFEKAREDSPIPHNYVNLFVESLKKLDA